MDTFEHENLTTQIPETEPIPEVDTEYREPPVSTTEVPPAQYRGDGRGRRESPYANSPYEMNPSARLCVGSRCIRCHD